MAKLVELDRRIADLVALYDSQQNCALTPFVPTDEALRRVADTAASLRSDLPPGHCGTGGAEEVLRGHLESLLGGLTVAVRSDRASPHRFVLHFIHQAGGLVHLDEREDEVRDRTLRAVLDAGPAILRATGTLAARVSGERREMLLWALGLLSQMVADTVPVLRESFPYANAAHLNLLADKLSRVDGVAEEVRAGVRAAPRPGGEDMVSGPDYRETLQQVYGIDLRDLLDSYRAEVDRCRHELERIGGNLDSGRDPVTIVREECGSPGSPESMLDLLRKCLAAAREEAVRFITLPEGERCSVRRAPDYLAQLQPRGGYFAGPGAGSGIPRGTLYLPAPEYRTACAGWIQVRAIHGGYPGHHAHHVRTEAADMPASFRLDTGPFSCRMAGPVTEGIAARSERLMQDIFCTPSLPLLVAFRRLKNAVRVWADLLLHHLGGDGEAAVQLYRRHVGLSRRAAREEVWAQRMTPAYFAAHHHGTCTLERLQKECGWSGETYTEIILSGGRVSLDVVRQLLKLPRGERLRLLTAFSTGLRGEEPLKGGSRRPQ